MANHFYGVARSFELFPHKQRDGKVYRFLFHTVYAYGPAVFPTVPSFAEVEPAATSCFHFA